MKSDPVTSVKSLSTVTSLAKAAGNAVAVVEVMVALPHVLPEGPDKAPAHVKPGTFTVSVKALVTVRNENAFASIVGMANPLFALGCGSTMSKLLVKTAP